MMEKWLFHIVIGSVTMELCSASMEMIQEQDCTKINPKEIGITSSFSSEPLEE